MALLSLRFRHCSQPHCLCPGHAHFSLCLGPPGIWSHPGSSPHLGRSVPGSTLAPPAIGCAMGLHPGSSPSLSLAPPFIISSLSPSSIIFSVGFPSASSSKVSPVYGTSSISGTTSFHALLDPITARVLTFREGDVLSRSCSVRFCFPHL